MGIEKHILSVEIVEKQVEIVTEQGVGIYGDGGLHLLTSPQQNLLKLLDALGLDEFVIDPLSWF